MREKKADGMTIGRKDSRDLEFATTEAQSVSREMIVHGQKFARVFDGYFSDPEVARPLVEAVESAVEETHPQTVADLGGGTGFVLEELHKRGLQGVRLVNVEASPKQLEACPDGCIIPLQTSIDKVTRKELLADDADGKLLIISRSVLHYFGRYGLDPLLHHIRGLLRPGELFIHQSGVFSRQQDADVINHLYIRMDSGKWFFTVEELKVKLEDAGFIVREVLPAPGLGMSSEDLGERYGLGPEQMAAIGREMEMQFGKSEVFVLDGSRFRAHLQASIFKCEAV